MRKFEEETMNKNISRIITWAVAALIVVLILYWFFLPRFAGDLPVNAVAIRIGSVAIHWYGIIIALALLLGYVLFVKPQAKKLGVNDDQLSTFILILVVAGIIGSRLGYVVQKFGYYRQNPLEILTIWQGGMSIHGALLLGAIATFIWARALKVNIWQLLDVLSPAVVLGMALGRVGNFLNQELIGVPAKVAWKMYVASAYRPAALAESQYFHPVFLYEMIFDLLILGILLYLAKKHPKQGLIFWSFIGLYSLGRVIVEIWRYNDVRYFWHLSLAQIVSFILIIISTSAILMITKPKFFDKFKKV